jgi:excisionase family DNA binding protein
MSFAITKRKAMNTTKSVLEIENTNAANLLSEIAKIVKENLTKAATASDETALFITRQDVAEIFGVSLPTVHTWTNTGILKAYKIGNKTRYKKAEVLEACKPQNGHK